MKKITLQPINESVEIHTQQEILQALLAKELKVLMSCGGKGLCATCHVYIDEGRQQLTPCTEREKKTLSFISGTNEKSRLACQCQVLGEGVVVTLPEGMYVEKSEDLMDMIGERAETNILNPIDGSVIIEKGKIITKSRLIVLKNLKIKLDELKN